MITRELTPYLIKRASQLPIVGVIGPRQSGKTTLVKEAFANKPYVSLEDLDTRQYASEDTRGFLANFPNGAIFDEAQKVPELFSYLQTLVDSQNTPGQFILTGSQHFLLLEKISQSLAGRISLLTLLPLSCRELSQANLLAEDYLNLIFKGGYPRLYQFNLSPEEWYPEYIQTYIERDLRQLKNVHDLATFHRFVKMCAGRVGQLLNLSALANDCGITHNTAKSWISLLESSFIIFLLQPYHENFGKQLTKSPKLYFYDLGVACSLLDIATEQQLQTHYLRGGLFENLIISEIIKSYLNHGQHPQLFFWRDKHGHEIDCLIKKSDKLFALEIKSSQTIANDFFANLKYWQNLSGNPATQSALIYGGNQIQQRSLARVYPWQKVDEIKNFET